MTTERLSPIQELQRLDAQSSRLNNALRRISAVFEKISPPDLSSSEWHLDNLVALGYLNKAVAFRERYTTKLSEVESSLDAGVTKYHQSQQEGARKSTRLARLVEQGYVNLPEEQSLEQFLESELLPPLTPSLQARVNRLEETPKTVAPEQPVEATTEETPPPMIENKHGRVAFAFLPTYPDRVVALEALIINPDITMGEVISGLSPTRKGNPLNSSMARRALLHTALLLATKNLPHIDTADDAEREVWSRIKTATGIEPDKELSRALVSRIKTWYESQKKLTKAELTRIEEKTEKLPPQQADILREEMPKLTPMERRLVECLVGVSAENAITNREWAQKVYVEELGKGNITLEVAANRMAPLRSDMERKLAHAMTLIRKIRHDKGKKMEVRYYPIFKSIPQLETIVPQNQEVIVKTVVSPDVQKAQAELNELITMKAQLQTELQTGGLSNQEWLSEADELITAKEAEIKGLQPKDNKRYLTATILGIEIQKLGPLEKRFIEALQDVSADTAITYREIIEKIYKDELESGQINYKKALDRLHVCKGRVEQKLIDAHVRIVTIRPTLNTKEVKLYPELILP